MFAMRHAVRTTMMIHMMMMTTCPEDSRPRHIVCRPAVELLLRHRRTRNRPPSEVFVQIAPRRRSACIDQEIIRTVSPSLRSFPKVTVSPTPPSRTGGVVHAASRAGKFALLEFWRGTLPGRFVMCAARCAMPRWSCAMQLEVGISTDALGSRLAADQDDRPTVSVEPYVLHACIPVEPRRCLRPQVPVNAEFVTRRAR